MKIKSLIAGACVGAIALSSAAFADEAVLISENTAEKSIYVNDAKIDATYYVDTDGITMIPVRKVCEALGFNVGWDEETQTVTVEKMPLYFTFNAHQDGYTMAKTAPILLGKAPYLDFNTTYVPISFATEIMPCITEIDGGRIDIISEDGQQEEKAEATVIFKGQTDGMTVLYDALRGEVLANVSNETAIKDVEGNVIKLEDIVEGQLLKVTYDNFMTMSLPPITNALEMTVLTGDMAELVEGTICEVLNDENATQIIIGDETDPLTQTAFNISDETTLIAVDGTAAELSAFEKGKKISVVASMAATRSIPAQRAAYSVRIAE